MRYFETAQIQTGRPATVPLEKFRRRLNYWLARRKLRSLHEYDDHILEDIGVTRGELEWASHLPLKQNAAHELNRKARARRDAERVNLARHAA